MIVTVTANAAVDRTLHVARLERGARVDVTSDRSQAGGKGVNVARVLHALGVRTHAVVVVGGEPGEAILRDLAAAGIPATAVRASGASRTCLEVVEASGTVTQLHGPGVRGDQAVAGRLLAACADLLPGARWLAVCGSLAPGLPADTAARLVRLARSQGVPSALDTRGPALGAALAEGPSLWHANREEAEEALGARAEAAPGDPRLAGIDLTVVSAGPDPVEAFSAQGARWRLRPPAVALRNPVGCGDAMLAGLLARLAAGAGPEAALRHATALGAADAESPWAGHPDPARAARLEAEVKWERRG